MSRSQIKNLFFRCFCCHFDAKGRRIVNKQYRKKEKQNISPTKNIEDVAHVKPAYFKLLKGFMAPKRKIDPIQLSELLASRYAKNEKEKIALNNKIYYRLLSK